MEGEKEPDSLTAGWSDTILKGSTLTNNQAEAEMNMENNMRAFPRLSLACDIEFSISQEKTGAAAVDSSLTVVSKTRDISKGGICLITYEPLVKGDILDLKFTLGSEKKVIEATGRVAWTQTFEIGNQKGYDNGIEFIDIPDEYRDIIEKYIQQMFSV